MKPRVIICMEGGRVSYVYTSEPMKIMVKDYNTDGACGPVIRDITEYKLVACCYGPDTMVDPGMAIGEYARIKAELKAAEGGKK